MSCMYQWKGAGIQSGQGLARTEIIKQWLFRVINGLEHGTVLKFIS